MPQPIVGGSGVEPLIAVFRNHGDIFDMCSADIRPVGQDDPRLEAHHHVLDDFERDGLVHQRVAVQAEAELAAERYLPQR